MMPNPVRRAPHPRCRFFAPALFRARVLLLWVAVLLAAHTFAQDAVPDIYTTDATEFSSLLHSSRAERRIEGIQGLSHFKYHAAETNVLRLLEDPDRNVRLAALSALSRIGTPKSISRLIECLNSADWQIREEARLTLPRITGHETNAPALHWAQWWNGSTLSNKCAALLATAASPPTNNSRNALQKSPDTMLKRGKRVRALPGSAAPPSAPERRTALRALRHLVQPSNEPALISLLAKPQSPPLDADERAFICEALERVGSAACIPVLVAQRSEPAAWALARIGGLEAERGLLSFPPSLASLSALDRLHSTNTASLIPYLVRNMAQITYRSHPDDVMNGELQPIQRLGANLIRRSGQAPLFIERTLQALEDTMQPPVKHGAAPAIPQAWETLFSQMQSELKPGFVREDGVTTSQPLVAACYLLGGYTAAERRANADTNAAAIARRLIPLLNHPAFVPRVYVALALGRMQARQALPALTNIIAQGYAFSDSTALASGKHYDQSQTVRWKGFLCMALGRLGGPEARTALEHFATDTTQPRDIRYSSVVGLHFIAAPESLPSLKQVADHDAIWMIRDEALRACEHIEVLRSEELAQTNP